MSLFTRTAFAWSFVPALVVASAARADVNELLGRVPPYANAVVVVDAALTGDAADAGAAASRPKSPFPLPKVAGLRSLVLAARIHTGSMEPVWEVALMEVGRKPSMQAVAQVSGGYTDTAAGRPAAACPNNVYCIAISDRVVGAVYPADRQFVARWLGEQRPAAAPAAQDYLRAAAAKAGPETPLVLAFDLADAVSEVGVRRVLETERPGWMGAVSGDDKTVAALLASVRGVTIRIGKLGADGAAGTIAIDFGKDTTPLATVARDLVTGVMAERGISITDLAQWEFTASGRAITGHGNLSVQGIERLVEFLSLPGISAPGDPGEATTAGARTEAANPEQAKAEASRKYFKTVSGILDSFQPGPTLAEGAGWLSRAAKRIDQLPADNVDPDLLVWGAEIGSNLREAASVLSTGQQRVRARTNAIALSTAYAQTGNVLDAQAAAQARTDRENSKRYATQAGAEERAAVLTEANKPLQVAMESRGKIRAEMVKRYGAGF